MSSRVPKYSPQREAGRSNRAYVRIDGKKIQLGTWQSAESKTKYAQLIKADESEGVEKFSTPLPSAPTVNEILVGYRNCTKRQPATSLPSLDTERDTQSVANDAKI